MIEKKRPQHMSMEIQFLAWDWYKNVSAVYRRMGSPPSAFLIIGSKTVTHEVRFWCYFTETTVHRTRV
jgi:hypothetical protein